MRSIRIVFVKALIIFLIITPVLVQAKGRFSAKVKLDFRVINDEGQPVSKAMVNGYFLNPNKYDGCGDTFHKVTDTNGYCKIKGRGYEYIEGVIAKTGYYKSHYVISLGNRKKAEKIGKWSLRNPKVVLREIQNPIPMYAKKVETHIPATNTLFGYDLMKGDWVAPLGKGDVSDFVFKVDGWWVDYRNNESTLTLTFSNVNDGLVLATHDVIDKNPTGSEFILPRYAPESGYINLDKWHLMRTQISGNGSDKRIDEVNVEGRGYLFRVRSQTNNFGVVTNAYYGKIQGNFKYAGAAAKGGSWLKFTYYLNPTPNDRNLEFAPKTSLFPDQRNEVYRP